MSETLWQLRSVSLFRGPGGSRPRLDDLTLNIEAGATAIMGCSGSGKTSLLNLLVGFEKPDRGQVRATLLSSDGRLPLFWVPPNEGLWPHLTVAEHLGHVIPSGAEQQEQIGRLLEAFDLGGLIAALPGTLSAGERARLAVARALAARPRVLVMDEPLVHVDRLAARRYWQLVSAHAAETGTSLVFATHWPEVVVRGAPHVVYLKEGRALYDGPVEDLYWRPSTEELAFCLGDANWLRPEEAELWLGPAEWGMLGRGPAESGVKCGCSRSRPQATQAIVLRPEQVQLIADANSPIQLRAARSSGTVAESQLVHEPSGQTRWFFHRPHPEPPGPRAPRDAYRLREGQRVAVRVVR